jgi:hypothetical protein
VAQAEVLADDWPEDSEAKLSRLQSYADRPVSAAAWEAYIAALSWGLGEFDSPAESFVLDFSRFSEAELKMLILMRNSLSIPDVDPTMQPPGWYDEPSPDVSAPDADST